MIAFIERVKECTGDCNLLVKAGIFILGIMVILGLSGAMFFCIKGILDLI